MAQAVVEVPTGNMFSLHVYQSQSVSSSYPGTSILHLVRPMLAREVSTGSASCHTDVADHSNSLFLTAADCNRRNKSRLRRGSWSCATSPSHITSNRLGFDASIPEDRHSSCIDSDSDSGVSDSMSIGSRSTAATMVHHVRCNSDEFQSKKSTKSKAVSGASFKNAPRPDEVPIPVFD